MIAAWMAYALVVGGFFGGAAWVVERLLRSHRRPTRFVWLAGLTLSTLWPAWTLLRPAAEDGAGGPLPGLPLIALEPLVLQVGASSIWTGLDALLLTLWAVSSWGLLLFGILLLFRARALRKGCRGEEAGGQDVLISQDLGPAVVGFLDPRIILPQWCQGMEETGLRLILDHELEHLRAGDLRLAVLSAAFPILFPWSLPVWWMWVRLRIAAEGDCDLRVLKRNPRATRKYVELLLEVGQRFPGGWAAAAMLSEPERTMARRIRTMTMPFPKKPLLRGIILVGVGLILIAVACGIPTPAAVETETELPPVAAEAQGETQDLSELAQKLIQGPTYTPMTHRPGVTNRAEVAAAMEREYPPLLKEAGVGGTTVVWFFIDEGGAVREVSVNESSGHPALDDAALRVAEMVQFSPAMDEDEPVPVWIGLPIHFTVRELP